VVLWSFIRKVCVSAEEFMLEFLEHDLWSVFWSVLLWLFHGPLYQECMCFKLKVYA